MITSTLLMLAVGLFAGIMGAILGIGGGMIITPIITLALGLDINMLSVPALLPLLQLALVLQLHS